MSISFNAYVDEQELAETLIRDPGFTLDVLSLIAQVDGERGGDVVDELVFAHNLSSAHLNISPFLTRLAAALDEFAAQEEGER